MGNHMFIVGEWGSVAMRLDLCSHESGETVVIDTVTGSGVVGCSDFEAAFFGAADVWFASYGPVPVILAGMIGSNIGWRDSGYVDCPANIDSVAARIVRMQVRGVDIYLTPGLRCRNIFDLPDIIRGEDIQILGWLRQNPHKGQRLVCLPGRHVKWLLTEGDRILSFFTGMIGELEDLLLTHSLLGKGVARNELGRHAFQTGMSVMTATPSLSLGHALFATRSRLVIGEHSAQEASGFLAGLLVGSDVRDSLSAHAAQGLASVPVVLLGHGAIRDLYQQAFAHLGRDLIEIVPPRDGTMGLAAVFAAAELLQTYSGRVQG